MQIEQQELKRRRHEAFLQMCREEFHRTRGEEWSNGLSHLAGVVFYVMDHTPYMHTVWHVFVLGGIVCHWCCIMFSVIPRG